jgi:hypothetical protein
VLVGTRIATFALALCLALIACSAQSQRRPQQVRVKQPEATITQPKSPEDQRGTEQSPLIVKVAPAPKTDAERAEEAKESERIAEADRKKEKSDADLVKYTAELAFFTKALFAATVALVIATIGLGFAAFRQSRDMKSSIAVADKAANAAVASADAVVSQLRAYVSITAASIQGFQQNGHIRLNVRIENRGHTPAYELTHDGGFTLREADVSRFKGDLWPPERNMLLSKATLPPGVIRHAFTDVSRPLSPDAKAAIREGTLGLFAYGEIRYRDVFGNSHISTYRLMYGGYAPVTDDQLTICEEGNYED